MQQVNNEWSIDVKRLENMIPVMIAEQRKLDNQNLTRLIHPENRFLELTELVNDPVERSQLYFIAALFDQSKKSYVHLHQHMISLVLALHPELSHSHPNSGMFSYSQNFMNLDNKLNSGGINILKGIGDLYSKPVSSAEYLNQLDKWNRTVMQSHLKAEHVFTIAQKIVEEYDSDPRILSRSANRRAQDKLTEMPYFGDNIAYLFIRYCATQSGWTDLTYEEIDLLPKIDRNDIYFLLGSEVIKVEGKPRFDVIVKNTAKTIYGICTENNHSISLFDDAMWTTSMIYSNGLSGQPPGENFCTKSQYIQAALRVDNKKTGRIYLSLEDKQHDIKTKANQVQVNEWLLF